MTRTTNPRPPQDRDLLALLDASHRQMIHELSDCELDEVLRDEGVDPDAVVDKMRGFVSRLPLYLSSCRVTARSMDDLLHPWFNLVNPTHPSLWLRLHLSLEEGTAEITVPDGQDVPEVRLDIRQPQRLEFRHFGDEAVAALAPEVVERLAKRLELPREFRTWADSKRAPTGPALGRQLVALAAGTRAVLSKAQSRLLNELWHDLSETSTAALRQALADMLGSPQPAYRREADSGSSLTWPEPLVLVGESDTDRLMLEVVWQTSPSTAPTVQVLIAGEVHTCREAWNRDTGGLELNIAVPDSEDYGLSWTWQAAQHHLTIWIDPVT